MKFNQIVNDIIDWIRRILWYKENKVKKKPYDILEITDGAYGLIKRVARDTPRAVLTYIYTPYPVILPGMTKPTHPIYDYHICLDHLWAVDNAELHTKSFQLIDNKKSFKLIKNSTHGKKLGIPTHRISVFQASRTLDKDGSYVTIPVYAREYDFIGTDHRAYRDQYASPILKDVIKLLTTRRIKEISWEIEIEFSQKHFMGGKYLGGKYRLPEPQTEC